jgi:hypothetical protein
MKIKNQIKGIFLLVIVWFSIMIISVIQYGVISLMWWGIFYVLLGMAVYGGMLVLKDGE